ncbi:ABC-type transport system involved in cytochrome bd biosynthesis fused ATPase/permease subunit [Leucobacter luti]|uniref:ABC transporter ATP-binding protein/permease n=1 Tax=Leucobacter luti TaxID=340320 RepID=UPI00104FA430|nr:ATP-binding cassette domain-containing protein [Leucobacter luti]MCW2289152.1 ABC-type transport system involved in cytochrome bd biosynthesis fused ATPase/permease subunit [Leucobacter luti]TCK35451.1 ABC-type transport system involved in cytochrome bd biosynthesis fused ATPase/permease subunit [Leucobacter luti]
MIHRRLLQLAGAVPWAIVVLGVGGILISALHIGFAFTLATMIAAIVNDQSELLPAFLVLAGVAAARGGAIWVREILAARLGVFVRIRIRRRLLDRLSGVPIAERDAGTTAATVLDGVEGLDPYYTRYLPQLLVTCVVPAGVVVLVWAHSPVSGIVLAVAVAGAVLVPRIWDARLLGNGRLRWERFARVTSDYGEALQQIPLLRAFGATGRTASGFAAETNALRNLTMSQLRMSLVETALSALAMQLGIVLAVIATIAAVANGHAQAATAVLVLMLAREAFRPVQELGTNWHAGYLGLSAVDGLDRLFSTPLTAYGNHASSACHGAVGISNVTYRYPSTSSGIVDLSLTIESGEIVAVIGPSGSGKSTLARLLEREVTPHQGTITVGGIPLHDFTHEARTRSVVVVPQDPVLFAWTVSENLRLYRPDASDEEIFDAARTAHLHDVVSRLPAGYGTVLAENGGQLSGGQRQRLAIARALLSPAPVLVLDEVTAALDLDTERLVMESIAAASRTRTVIVIAHRQTACTHATRWVAMRDGRITVRGDGAPAARNFTSARGRET